MHIKSIPFLAYDRLLLPCMSINYLFLRDPIRTLS